MNNNNNTTVKISSIFYILRYLQKMLASNSGIRKQDGSIVFNAVAENKHGYHLAFEFLSNNWHDIQQ